MKMPLTAVSLSLGAFVITATVVVQQDDRLLARVPTSARTSAPTPANGQRAAAPAATASATYVGSQACRRCHTATYERWAKTRMAKVVQDPREHPEAVIPDFSKPDPLLTFTLNDVAFVYGTKWKQRYFQKAGNDYVPLPAQWDVKNRVWRAYLVQPNTDWWVPHYPANNAGRPTGPLCDGCHSVNYDVKTKAVKEWNVGCEKCHGPGSAHVAGPTAANIVNPAKLDFVRANDTCIQCHSQGQPLKNPVEGRYYDWPVGFHQGAVLQRPARGLDHRVDKAGR